MCGVAQEVWQAAEWMVARERLLIKNVHGRAGDLTFAQHFKEIGFDHDWSARRIHKSCRRLHKGEFCGTHEAARALAEDHVDGEDIRLPEQLILRNEFGARCRGAIGGEILAPRDDPHAEGLTDLSNRRSDIS